MEAAGDGAPYEPGCDPQGYGSPMEHRYGLCPGSEKWQLIPSYGEEPALKECLQDWERVAGRPQVPALEAAGEELVLAVAAAPTASLPQEEADRKPAAAGEEAPGLAVAAAPSSSLPQEEADREPAVAAEEAVLATAAAPTASLPQEEAEPAVAAEAGASQRVPHHPPRPSVRVQQCRKRFLREGQSLGRHKAALRVPSKTGQRRRLPVGLIRALARRLDGSPCPARAFGVKKPGWLPIVCSARCWARPQPGRRSQT